MRPSKPGSRERGAGRPSCVGSDLLKERGLRGPEPEVQRSAISVQRSDKTVVHQVLPMPGKLEKGKALFAFGAGQSFPSSQASLPRDQDQGESEGRTVRG